MDIGEETDLYIPRIRWTQDPKKLAIIRLNRLQNKMEVLLANARTGVSNVLYREENKYYIDESNFDNLFFTADGQHFIITSEKSGYMHLYLYDMTDTRKKRLLPDLTTLLIFTATIRSGKPTITLLTRSLPWKSTSTL